jgi:molecular chaperone HtpG
VTEEQYADFYRHVAHAFDTPWATLHWRAEGSMEFSALLFVPGMKPFQAVEGERESRVRLHVRRMFITDQANLLPPWLRFVQGVVDTEDLPLNVSREMLQATPVLARIRKAVTNRVLSELKTRAKDATDYAVLGQFRPRPEGGRLGGCRAPQERRGLLRFRSSAVEGWTSLADYVVAHEGGQEAIYILVGDERGGAGEVAAARGFPGEGRGGAAAGGPSTPSGRSGWAVSRTSRCAASPRARSTSPRCRRRRRAEAADVTQLLPLLKDALKDEVAEVRRRTGWWTAPSCWPRRSTARTCRCSAAAPRWPRRRRRAAGAGGEPAPSADPPLAEPPRPTPPDEKAGLLLDLARVQDGDTPRDPAAFARQVAAALAGNS